MAIPHHNTQVEPQAQDAQHVLYLQAQFTSPITGHTLPCGRWDMCVTKYALIRRVTLGRPEHLVRCVEHSITRADEQSPWTRTAAIRNVYVPALAGTNVRCRAVHLDGIRSEPV